jgi:hypothetical protein
MSIDEFIDIVAPKLDHPLKTTDTFMTGKDLKLTGFAQRKGVAKLVHGPSKNKIDDNGVYKVKVPVEPEKLKSSTHRMKLRLAWLRGGKPAVRTYLLKYMNEDDVTKAISVI